jgi:hypothetical protein
MSNIVSKYEFHNYTLVVTDKGFYLIDSTSDHLLVDASDLQMHYPVELDVPKDRDVYVRVDTDKSTSTFGFTQKLG